MPNSLDMARDSSSRNGRERSRCVAEFTTTALGTIEAARANYSGVAKASRVPEQNGVGTLRLGRCPSRHFDGFAGECTG